MCETLKSSKKPISCVWRSEIAGAAHNVQSWNIKAQTDKHVQTLVSCPKKQPAKRFCKTKKTSRVCECVKRSKGCLQMLLLLGPFFVFVFAARETARNTLCFTPAEILRRTLITWCSWTLQTTEAGAAWTRVTVTEETETPLKKEGGGLSFWPLGSVLYVILEISLGKQSDAIKFQEK